MIADLAARCYRGRRPEDHRTVVTTPDGTKLPTARWIQNHSPTGFEWGYGGSGPAQLALALLFHWHGCGLGSGPGGWKIRQRAKILAIESYQVFKNTVVTRLPRQWDLDPLIFGDWYEFKEELALDPRLRWDSWWDLMTTGGWIREYRDPEVTA